MFLYLVICFLCCIEIIYFNIVPFVCFCFCCLCFKVISPIFLLMFSDSDFIFKQKYFIKFELIFVYGISSSLILLLMSIQFPTTFIRKTICAFCILVAPVGKIRPLILGFVPGGVWCYFIISIFIPPCCFNYSSFRLFVFQIALFGVFWGSIDISVFS